MDCFLQIPLIKMDNPATRFSDEFLIVGCDDYRGAAGMEPLKKLKNDIGGYFVQIAGGFIC
jgi:hypothetical protein